MGNAAKPKIIWVIDEKISRSSERKQSLTHILSVLREKAEIQLLHSPSVKEGQDLLLKKLEEQEYQLALAPVDSYLAWTKIENLFGKLKTAGPVFSGYTMDTLPARTIQNANDRYRLGLLDLANLAPAESAKLIFSLCSDATRIGVESFLDPNALVYVEMWQNDSLLGSRLEAVLSLPEIQQFGWNKRANAIRICLSGLHSLVNEEGKGQSELAKALGSKNGRAYFQIGADKQCMIFRVYTRSPFGSPKEVLGAFLPNPEKPVSGPQLLLRYADFVRIHPVAETADLEITVGLWASAPSEKTSNEIHTLWFDPVTQNVMMNEAPYLMPGAEFPFLRALPNGPVAKPVAEPKMSISAPSEAEKAKDRQLLEAKAKILDLKHEISERDSIIRELKSGGVGTAPPLPPPDTESLLDAFKEHYQIAKDQIAALRQQIQQAEQGGASPKSLEHLKQQIILLTNQEKNWIRKLSSTFEAFRAAKGGGRKDGTGGKPP